MRFNRLTTLGAAMLLAGLAVFGTLFSYAAHPAAAGDPTVTQTCVPGQTCQTSTLTPQRIKTHTPTSTATSKPVTHTPVPPTGTSVPPTSVPTRPTGGNEGVAVKPPNTGSGQAASGGATSIWLIVLGAVLVLAGGATVVTGARKRG